MTAMKGLWSGTERRNIHFLRNMIYKKIISITNNFTTNTATMRTTITTIFRTTTNITTQTTTTTNEPTTTTGPTTISTGQRPWASLATVGGAGASGWPDLPHPGQARPGQRPPWLGPRPRAHREKLDPGSLFFPSVSVDNGLHIYLGGIIMC